MAFSDKMAMEEPGVRWHGECRAFATWGTGIEQVHDALPRFPHVDRPVGLNRSRVQLPCSESEISPLSNQPYYLDGDGLFFDLQLKLNESLDGLDIANKKQD